MNISSAIPSKFTFHDDAGHGWLAVPIEAVKELNIHNLISKYSYRKGDMAYLEEDCDAPLFIKAYLRHQGKSELDFQSFYTKCTTVHDGDHSPIRHYSTFR